MQFLALSDKTKEEALKIQGGYTCLNYVVLVVTDEPMCQDFIYESCIVVGYEYGAQGEFLSYSTSLVYQIIKAIVKQGYNVSFCRGGYIYKNGEMEEEKCFLLMLDNSNDTQLAILAERLRVAFRQESVLLVLSTGEALFVEE